METWVNQTRLLHKISIYKWEFDTARQKKYRSPTEK